MLLFVHGRTLKAGFDKELLFMGVVDAGVADQVFKNSIQRRLGAAHHQPVVQLVDQYHQSLVVIIQELHTDTHMVCPNK